MILQIHHFLQHITYETHIFPQIVCSTHLVNIYTFTSIILTTQLVHNHRPSFLYSHVLHNLFFYDFTKQRNMRLPPHTTLKYRRHSPTRNTANKRKLILKMSSTRRKNSTSPLLLNYTYQRNILTSPQTQTQTQTRS